MRIVIAINAGCGYCAALQKITAAPKFRAWAANHPVTETQYNSAAGRAALKAFGYSGTLRVPIVCVFGDAGERLGSFTYRPPVKLRTPEDLIARIEAACGGSCAPSAPKTPCPACNGTGYLSLILAGALAFLTAGCVLTSGKFKPPATPKNPNPTEVSVFRFAILYPFEVADVSYGDFRMGQYKTTGGAAELVPLVDASGNLIGTIVGKAAKTAVVP